MAHYKLYTSTVKIINKIENFDTDSVKIIINTGASSSATNDEFVFVPGSFRAISGLVALDILSSLVAEGFGTFQ